MSNNPLWIAGIARGHNAAICLMKDGEIVFAIEEERLTRQKYDGGPLACMLKIKEYTDKLDYLVIAHTTSLEGTAGKLDYSGEDIYSGLARKMGLIEPWSTDQIIDMSMYHHKMHAAAAFYRSGFEEAVSVIIDGAGTFFPVGIEGPFGTEQLTMWETESIFTCNYPDQIITKHKTMGTKDMFVGIHQKEHISESWEPAGSFEVSFSDRAGIVKAYEAVTEYCGWSSIEAGKTMGLSPYGKENEKFPLLMDKTDMPNPLTNRNIIVPRYPNGAVVNSAFYKFLDNHDAEDLTTLENRRDLAYAVQKETQQAAVDYIRYAVEKTGIKNIVISGGYGLNCVANYFYLKELDDLDIDLYVEPVSNDAGTAIGSALVWYHHVTGDITVRERQDSVYLGPEYNYTNDDITKIVEKYEGKISTATNQEIIELMTEKNIVACFQGRSENGPRALGNRSLMFDPTFEDGKDWVNRIKRREYFRPFAGSILEEDVHEWFDLRGMKNSPTMMYAVNCHPGVEEKIPSIIHVDGTCRIQTVNKEQNPHYYDIIKTFKNKTGCPVIFNTSFNLGGEPLVETLDDACRTLANSEIEYLYLPESNTLITIKNK